MVYPEAPCVYRYDPDEYYTVGPGHPFYDPEYDRGGEVLLEIGGGEIDLSIYQAPNIVGFEESTDGNEGYVFTATQFALYVDGFSNKVTTYPNILVIFDGIMPGGCEPEISIDGEMITGLVYPIGDLLVSTPTEEGEHYSDSILLEIDWHGCYGVHIWAFSDENYNGTRDGGECFTAFSHDSSIPTHGSTWGAIKNLTE